MLEFVALALALAGPAHNAGSSESVHFVLDDAGAVIVPVILDRRPITWKFLLDTGSSHTIVSSTVADTLGLEAVAKTAMQTSTGTETQVVVRLAEMTIGSASAEGLLPSVIPAAQLQAVLPGIDGIVGQDFLGRFDYTVDYRTGRLTWTAEPGATSGTRLPTARQSGQLKVLLPAVGGQPGLSLVPDSGAEAFVLFERAGRTALSVERSTILSGIAGAGENRSTAELARLRQLRIGGFTMKNVRAVVMQRAEDDWTEGDGLLPLRLFASVSFSSRDGYIILRK